MNFNKHFETLKLQDALKNSSNVNQKDEMCKCQHKRSLNIIFNIRIYYLKIQFQKYLFQINLLQKVKFSPTKGPFMLTLTHIYQISLGYFQIYLKYPK